MRDERPADTAEKAVLGAIMAAPGVMGRIRHIIHERDFERAKHQVIFRAAAALDAAGVAVDPVTVDAELKRMGKEGETGGIAYLVHLGDNLPTTSNVEHYAGEVRNASVDRALRRTAERLNAKGAGIAERIAAAQQDLTSYSARLDGRKADDLEVVCAADVKPESIDWLWSGRIPYGALTLLDGDPGLGKSTISLDLAARITRGDSMPQEVEFKREPRGAVILAAEDSASATIVPRLTACGAVLERVHIVVSAATLPEDVERIGRVVRDKGAGIVVVDPVMAYFGADIDSYRDQDVRRALSPLVALAQSTHVAMLVLRHLRKTGGGKDNGGPALYRGGGSIGISGAARSVLTVGPNPNDSTTRVLASVKSNLGPPPQTLGYDLESMVVAGCQASRVRWLGVVDATADEALNGAGTSKASNRDDDDDRAVLSAIRSREEAGSPETSRALIRGGVPGLGRERVSRSLERLMDSGKAYLQQQIRGDIHGRPRGDAVWKCGTGLGEDAEGVDA